jgi:hypothetical protein
VSVRKRIRHGVVFEPGLGYRAVCEIDGDRRWIGPWTTEAKADANAAASTQAWKDSLDAHGAIRETGDTPLGVWAPKGTT